LKVKLAARPGWPKLHIAKTGLTTGVENVMVCWPAKLPCNRMSSLTTLGEVVTVPPMNELFGAQMPDVPLSTLPITSPEYETLTPPSVPAADPGAPTVALVQSVHAPAQAY